MNFRTLSLALLLTIVQPVWAQQSTVDFGGNPRPLNLSLPRHPVTSQSTFVMQADDDIVRNNLRDSQVSAGRSTARLPYGSGYEARQRENTLNGSYGTNQVGSSSHGSGSGGATSSMGGMGRAGGRGRGR